jgi:hypothetical protein
MTGLKTQIPSETRSSKGMGGYRVELNILDEWGVCEKGSRGPFGCIEASTQTALYCWRIIRGIKADVKHELEGK